jgi:DNA primase
MNVKTLKEKLNNRAILTHLGFEASLESDGLLRGICPIHKGDNTTAFVFKEESNLWYCHTGCKRGGDIINLVMEVNEVSFAEAINIVCKLSGIDPLTLDIDKKTQNKYENFEVWLKELKGESKEELDEYQILTQGETPLTRFRQFGEEICAFFDLKHAERIKIGEVWVYNKIIFPIKQNNKIVGATLRAVHKDDQVKWVNVPPKLKKKSILYNIDNIEKNKPVVIVEGVTDLLAVYNSGLTNVVSTLGSVISEEQVELLLPLTTELIFMYDGDSAGQLGVQASKKLVKSYFDCYTCVLKHDEDPGGLNSEQILNYYKSRRRM